MVEAMDESEKERQAKRKEKALDDLINQMAMAMIEENKNIVGKEVADKAKEKIAKAKTKEKGGSDKNEKKENTRRSNSRKSI